MARDQGTRDEAMKVDEPSGLKGITARESDAMMFVDLTRFVDWTQ